MFDPDYKPWLQPLVLSLVMVLLYNTGKLSPQMVGCLAPMIVYVLIDTFSFYIAVLMKVSKE